MPASPGPTRRTQDAPHDLSVWRGIGRYYGKLVATNLLAGLRHKNKWAHTPSFLALSVDFNFNSLLKTGFFATIISTRLD